MTITARHLLRARAGSFLKGEFAMRILVPSLLVALFCSVCLACGGADQTQPPPQPPPGPAQTTSGSGAGPQTNSQSPGDMPSTGRAGRDAGAMP